MGKYLTDNLKQYGCLFIVCVVIGVAIGVSISSWAF